MRFGIIHLVIIVCSCATSIAQVGINTTDPKALLDIEANTSPSNTDGILIPRVNEFPTGMTLEQDGMLAFLTGSGAPTKGFYFYNHGTGWVSINTNTNTQNTLDKAYDQGGAGSGRNITADAGPVRINGEEGLLVTGTFGSGDPIDTEITGTGTRLFFNPYKAAFRAGFIDGDDWDDNEIGDYSFATGYDTRALGEASVALGYDTSSRGNYSFAMGKNVTALAPLSVVFGESSYSTINAIYSFTLGFSAEARNEYTFSFGNNTDAHGQYSFAFGDDIAAHSYGEIAMGLNNTNYTPQSTTAWNAADRLFVLGNGPNTANASDAFIVYKDGRVEINQAYELPNTDGILGQVLTTDGAGTVAWASSGNGNRSLVKAALASNQVLATTGWQKLLFTSEIVDTTSEFNLTTNRFEASQDGYYSATVQFHTLNSQTNTQEYGLAIYLNGTLEKEILLSHHNAGRVTRQLSGFFQLNMGEFLEIYIYNTQTGVTIDAAISKTILEVERIR